MAWCLFYSYSHKDAELREQLGTHLAPLKRRQKIGEWHDRKIEPGANWHTEISSQLETADLILFLLSADFMDSEYCFGVEVEKAMERAKRGEVKIAPILLRPLSLVRVAVQRTPNHSARCPGDHFGAVVR
jgi:hypothetical protein